jgi:hypothetical protein
MAEEALPQMLSKKTNLKEKIVEEQKRYHRWLTIVFYYSPGFPRILRVLSIANNVLLMLFIQSLTYNYTHADDGSCESYKNQEDCLAKLSVYGTGKSQCYWTSSTKDDGSGGSCSFIQPENSMEIMLFVAIFSAVVTAPIAMGTNWVVQNFLAAPDEGILTRNNKNINNERMKKSDSQRIVPSNQVFPSSSSEAVTPIRRKASLLDYIFRRQNSTMIMMNLHRENVERDYANLVKDLLNYRSQIRDEKHRQEVDCKFVLFVFFLFLFICELIYCIPMVLL